MATGRLPGSAQLAWTARHVHLALGSARDREIRTSGGIAGATPGS